MSHPPWRHREVTLTEYGWRLLPCDSIFPGGVGSGLALEDLG